MVSRLYDRYVLPHLVHLACGSRPITRQRAKVVPAARGRVLDVGFGSGLNLRHYDREQVDFVWALEPSVGMRDRAAPQVARAGMDVRWLDLPGEEIPLEDASVDTIVLTYTLCTIPDFSKALAQMRRVLRRGGRLLFCEHGEAPDSNVRRWQARLNPIWRPLAGGCNLHRPIPKPLEGSGFAIEALETMYVPGLRVASFNYWGSARSA